MSGPLVGRVTAWEINYFIANYNSPAGKITASKIGHGSLRVFHEILCVQRSFVPLSPYIYVKEDHMP